MSITIVQHAPDCTGYTDAGCCEPVDRCLHQITDRLRAVDDVDDPEYQNLIEEWTLTSGISTTEEPIVWRDYI